MLKKAEGGGGGGEGEGSEMSESTMGGGKSQFG